MPPLKNPRQERFCLEYIATGNATQSAIKAGYSARTAYVTGPRDLLENPRISTRIAELREPREKELKASIDERFESLTEVIRESIKTPVTARERTSAVDVMNKMDKLYTDLPTGIQDNRTINIYIQGGEEAKARLERIMSGKLIPKEQDNVVNTTD